MLQQQDDAVASKAPKLFRETCEIDFAQSAATVHNFIRGLSPYPGAWTLLDGQELKVLRSKPGIGTPPIAPGAHFTDHKSWLRFAAADGWVEALELQLQGRKRMNAADFLKGYRFGG